MIVNTSLKNNFKTIIFLILSSCASYSNKEMQKNMDLNKIHDPKELMKIGDKYYEKSQLESSIEAYKLAISKLKGTEEENNLGLAHNSLGMCYQTKNNYIEAMKCYKIAMLKLNKSKNLTAMADCFHNMGTLKYLQKDFQGAIESYKSVLKLFDRLSISDYKCFETEYFLAQAYENSGMITYAKKIYERLFLIEEYHRKLDIAQAFYNLSIRFRIQKQYSKARECCEKVFVIRKQDKDLVGMTKILYNVGVLEYDQKNYAGAIQCYKEVLKIFVDLSFSRLARANIEYPLALAYEKEENFLSAKEICNKLVSVEGYSKKALEMLKNLNDKIYRLNQKNINENGKDVIAYDTPLIATQKKNLDSIESTTTKTNLSVPKTLMTRNLEKISQSFNTFVKGNKKKKSKKDQIFLCNLCNKDYSTKYNLKMHKRIHTAESPFKCDICYRVFSQNHSLINHRRIHTGEKPFECEICHKKFAVKYNLKIHRRIHTGEKPYSCKDCQKKFSAKSSLNSHVVYMHS